MPSHCISLVFRAPHILGQTRITNNTKKLTPTIHVGTCFPWYGKKTHQKKKLFHIVSQLKCSQNYPSSPVMEDERNLVVSSLGPDKYAKELDVAVKAVQMACSLCQKVQESLISKTNSQIHSKDDNSPVTVAGMNWPTKFCALFFFCKLGFLRWSCFLICFCWFLIVYLLGIFSSSRT